MRDASQSSNFFSQLITFKKGENNWNFRHFPNRSFHFQDRGSLLSFHYGHDQKFENQNYNYTKHHTTTKKIAFVRGWGRGREHHNLSHKGPKSKQWYAIKWERVGKWGRDFYPISFAHFHSIAINNISRWKKRSSEMFIKLTINK